MSRTRITDTARLDWMTKNKTEVEYTTAKVGPGWVRHAGWRIFIANRPAGNGDTLRQAIDAGMKTEQTNPTAECHFAREFEKSDSKSPLEALGVENQGIEQGASEPENALQVKYGSGIAISAPDFEHEWSTAPQWAKRTTEQECAEFWFLRGTIAGELQRTVDDNRMFREMAEQRGYHLRHSVRAQVVLIR